MAPDGKDILGGPVLSRQRSSRPRATLRGDVGDGGPGEGVEPRPVIHGDGARRKVAVMGPRFVLPARALGFASLVLLLVLFAQSASTVAEARSSDFSYGSYGSERDGNLRITCYTCMNVSNNDECNRYAIDRPCPEGRDYCLTVHVMEVDRSVLVNKRCAALEECTADSTGCSASDDGQTKQCVSCCDQPYCNDYAPSNETSAMFHRSSASGMLAGGPLSSGSTWKQMAAVLISTLCAATCSLVIS